MEYLKAGAASHLYPFVGHTTFDGAGRVLRFLTVVPKVRYWQRYDEDRKYYDESTAPQDAHEHALYDVLTADNVLCTLDATWQLLDYLVASKDIPVRVAVRLTRMAHKGNPRYSWTCIVEPRK